MKKLIAVLIVLFAGLHLNAQDFMSVKGTVVNASGTPVVGATVTAVGTRVSARTGTGGSFEMMIPNTVRYVRVQKSTYLAKNVQVRSSMKIILEIDKEASEKAAAEKAEAAKAAAEKAKIAAANTAAEKAAAAKAVAAKAAAEQKAKAAAEEKAKAAAEKKRAEEAAKAEEEAKARAEAEIRRKALFDSLVKVERAKLIAEAQERKRLEEEARAFVAEEARQKAIQDSIALAEAKAQAVRDSIALAETASSTIMAVDLGLSVKWASVNLGASSPEDYGDFYSWGETEAKENYSWSTYLFGKNDSGPFTKYNTDASCGMVDGRTILETGDNGDDAASKKLGDNWRIPTFFEWMELRKNCTWTWTRRRKVPGMLITSNKEGYTDKWIFLPAAGYQIDDTGSYYKESTGNYWSSTLNSGNPSRGLSVKFSSGSVLGSSFDRYYGLSIRPVCE